MLKIGSRVKFISEEITYWFYFNGWRDTNFNRNKKYIIVDINPSLVISIHTLNNHNNYIVGLLHPKDGIFYIELDGDKVCDTNYVVKSI
jgi:hypothetical protein